MSNEAPAPRAAKRGRLFIISGASGTGKTTLCRQMEQELGIYFSVSATTRSPREGEKPGRDYLFLTPEDFQNKLAAHEFLEWAKVHDNYYGTPVKQVEENLDQGRDVLLDLDTQGAFHVKKINPNAVLIFLKPPSLTDLQSRLESRKTDSLEEIARRVARAEEEIRQSMYYDYVVVNRDLSDAARELKEIIAKNPEASDRSAD